MFERILERILLAKIGKYIIGLDREQLKVAVWEGDIILENVYLKSDIFQMWQLPLVLKYGKITRLFVKIPWSRLASEPVEIILEGLYMVISPQQKEEWDYSEEGNIKKRKEYIELHEQRRPSTSDQKPLNAEEELQKKGYIEKLTSRIVDNLKVNIQDIHIRFEYHLENTHFSTGVTLEKIECNTTNHEWEKEFTDRHQSGSASLAIYKLVNILSLHMYWKCEDSFTLANVDELELVEFLYNKIYQKIPQESIIAPITAQMKVIHNNELSDSEVPKYLLELVLPEIYMRYEQSQFHDTVRLFEYLTEYNKFLLKIENKRKFKIFSPVLRTPKNLWQFAIKSIFKTIRQRKNRTVNLFRTPKATLVFFEESFKKIYRKIKESHELTEEEIILYDKVIYVSKLEDLYNWVAQVQSKMEWEAAIRTQQKKFSLWNFWKGSNQGFAETYEVFLESSSKDLVCKSYVWLVLQIKFLKGSMELCKLKELSGDYESLLFSYENCFFEFKLRLQGGSLSVILENLLLQSYNDYNSSQIFEKLKPNTLPLLDLSLDMNPIDSSVSYALVLFTQPLSIDLTPESLALMTSFFIVPEAKEAAKTAAWDTLQGLQDTTQETITDLLYGQTKYSIKIKARGPQIRIQAHLQGSFLLDLGIVEVQNSEDNESSEYESLESAISGIQLSYENGTAIESVIPQFQINWKLSFLKTKYKTLKWNSILGSIDSLPDFVIVGQLVKFKLITSPSIYHKLNKILETFKTENNSITNNTNEIVKKSVMSSWVKRKSKNIQQWHNYFSILSGGYIYFYINEDQRSPVNYYYIKDCSLEDVPNLGVSFCIRLRNRYGECVLSFNNELELGFWKRSLYEQILEFESYKSVAKDVIEDVRTAYKQRIRLEFEISTVDVILTNESMKRLAGFELGRINVDVQINPYDSCTRLSLSSMHVHDLIRVDKARFTTLVQSVADDKDLVSIELKLFSSKSPLYKNRDIEIKAAMGGLEINWNPDFISTILNFFEFAEYSDPNRVVYQKHIVNPGHVLMELDLYIESVLLYLNNVIRHITIGLVSVLQLKTVVSKMDGGTEIKGTLGNLEVSDLTNYPKTVISTGNVTKLFSVRKNAAVMMEFQISTYFEENPKKKLNITREIEVKMNSVNFYYYNQPVMRIIDYLSYKVLGVLDSMSRVRDTYTSSSVYRLSSLLDPSVIQAIHVQNFVQKSGFTSVKINVSNPLLNFYPRPGYEEFLVMDLGDILITNHQELDNTRGAEGVWIDLFKINMRNINIKSPEQTIAESFDLALYFHKPLLLTPKATDPETDKSYTIKAQCERLKLTLSQKDYTLILKLFDLNFSYDDQLDEYINPRSPDYNIVSKGKFLYFELNTKVMSILFKYEEESLVELFFANQIIKMWKYNNYSSVFNFTALHLIGLIPEEAVNSENPEHAEIAEAIFSISLDNIRNFEDYEDDDMRLSYVLFGPIGNIDANKPTISININTTPEGNKTMVIDITQLRLNFHLAAILQLQNFLYYAFPDYSSLEETPYDYMDKYRPGPGTIAKEVKTQYLAPELDMKLTIQEPIILLPSIIHQRVLVVQSDFSYSFFRDPESMYLARRTPKTTKSFEAMHLEIYTCKLTELAKHSFIDIVKRKILEPVQVIYKSIQTKFSPKVSSYNVDYLMGNFLFTLSHKDLMLIGNVFSFQQEMLEREQGLINVLKKSFGQKEDFLPRMSENERNLMIRLSGSFARLDSLESDPNEDYNCSPYDRSFTAQSESTSNENTSFSNLSVAGATLLLIFDTSMTYSPVVDINANDIRFTIEAVGNDCMYKTGAVIKSNFYNPILDTWEPFLEPVALQIESMHSPDNNPQHQGILIIEKTTVLNVNLSEIMISHFLGLAKGWRVKEESLIREVVSPISIKNSSGCDLLIEKNSFESRSTGEVIKLKNGQNKFYEVESMDMKSINLSQEYLNVSVLTDKKYFPCENIPINKVQSISYTIKNSEEELPIIFDIELKDTCKVFTVRSPVLIKNETAYDMNILFSTKFKTDEICCRSQETVPVPIPYIKSLLGLMPVSLHTLEWSMVRLDELNKDGEMKEIRVGDFYLCILVCTDTNNPKKITLCLRPPIIFKNQLPKTLKLHIFYEEGFNSKEVIILPNGEYFEHSRSGSIEISIIFTLENFQPSKKTLILSQREKPMNSIKINDYRNDFVQIQIYHIAKGSHIFNFYSAFILINSTELPVNFYYRKSGLLETVGGQNYIDSIVPCSPTRKISIGIGKERSDWMHVGTVGTEDIAEFLGEETGGTRTKYQFSYSVSLAKALESELVFSKVVLIVPRYIIINNMQEDISVRQYHATKQQFKLEKNSRMPFHWPEADKPEMIRVKVIGLWSWSGQFSLANIGTFTIQNRHRTLMNQYILINVEVKLVNRSFYVILEHEDDKFCSYRIENNSDLIHLIAYQKGCREEIRYLNLRSSTSFAWSKPQKDKEIVIEFCEKADENTPVLQTFSFDKINQTFTVNLKHSLQIYAQVECEGPTKILKFSDNSFINRKYEDDKIKNQFSISIPALGVSVIQYYKDTPQELLYFSLSGITFFAQENSKQWIAELLIAYIQLDNQASIPGIYPVILCPGKTDEKNVLHISMFYNFTNNPSIYCFDNCEFLMQEFALKLESKIVQEMVEMITRLFFNSRVVVSLGEVYAKNERPVWMRNDKIKLDKRYYFAKLALSPIKILLSLVPIKEDNDRDVYGTVSKALGMVITSIDLAPLKLNSLEMTDAFGSQWQILSVLKLHYGKQLIAELLSLIGHAEILGNPIGLLNKLGTGVKDFFYEPAQGMVNGPLSAGMGFIKGTGSLLKNTVEGTFGTVSKLANSVATGITTLTQDKEYLMDRQREQAMNKPRNIMDGVEMGVKSLFFNLGKGISGIVSEPVKGYKRNKITGMLIGSMRGLSGLVVKPVAGVLDVASKAAEGIKNAAGSNDHYGKSERKRFPRVFYGKNSVMKIYEHEDCSAYYLISKAKKGKYQKDKFVSFTEGYDLHGNYWIVYLFITKILLFAVKKEKVEWEIEINHIITCQLLNTGLALTTTPSTYKKTKNMCNFVFPFSDLRVNQHLLLKITDLL